MSRGRDSEIPTEEPLYRSISADDVIGDDVQPSAVEMPRCSFNRGAYSKPEDVFVLTRPNDNGIVEITPAELPDPVPRKNPASGKPYEFFAEDDPNPPEDPENDAHCEVRAKPEGSTFSRNHKMKKENRAIAQDALARRLRIIKLPE